MRKKIIVRGVAVPLTAALVLVGVAACGEPVFIQGGTGQSTAKIVKCLQVGREATARVLVKSQEPEARVFQIQLQFSAHQKEGGGVPGIIRTQTKNVGPIGAGRQGDLGFGEILEDRVSDLECDITAAIVVG